MSNKKLQGSDPRIVLGSILELDLSKCAVTVCLASLSTDGDAPKFEKLQLSDDLTGDFRDIVQAILAKRKKDAERGDLVLRAYDAGSKPDPHEVEHVDLSEHDTIKNQIASLSSLADLGVFAVSDDFVSGLRFYVIVIQAEHSSPIYCFRSYSPKKELRRSPIIAAILSRGTFDRVRKPLFLFDQHIDCMSRNGEMFVFNKDKFQKIFRFFEMVLKTAKATLRTIKARVPISNFSEFEKACEGHLQMLAKLKNIATKEYLMRITIADIKKVIKEFPQLGIKTTKSDGKEMLVFDPLDKWALLRLLDDDYLKSLMTGQNYEVTGKRSRQ